MTFPASKVEVWNQALLRIGETEFIESEEETGEEDVAGAICRQVWDRLLRQVLEAKPWPFAKKQSTIAKPTGVTRTGWEYCYQLPADCVTPIALLAEDERIGLKTEETKYPYDICSSDEGNSLLLCCDLDSESDDFEVLEYIYLNENIAVWPGEFVDAVAWLLARDLALGVKHDLKLAEEMYKMYFISLERAHAQAQNRRQEDPEQLPPSVLARS